MTPKHILELRARLAARLKPLIRNPVIEAKELAAFDLVMSRRAFLKTSTLAAMSALVMAGIPPTIWARRYRELKVCPGDVGLTDAEQASVGVATQLITGTELFQDSIYAQPVVAPDQSGKHAVIEGFRARSRIQSTLLNDQPDELQFLDNQYHYGLPELVQLEQDPVSGAVGLVHYRHPFAARDDGARTDGLIRDVLLSTATGDFSQLSVLALTGGTTNRFSTDAEGNQVNSAKYMIYVDGPEFEDRLILLGYGSTSVSAPYDQQPEYPVSWKPWSIFQTFPSAATYSFADTLSGSAWQSPSDNGAPEYDPAQQAEHLILYYSNGIGIVTLQDPPPEGEVGFLATWVPLPADASGVLRADLRVVHIDYDPTATDRGSLVNVVLAGSETAPSLNVTYHLYTINTAGNIALDQPIDPFNDATFQGRLNELDNNFGHRQTTISASTTSDGEFSLDYSTLRSVKGLHTTIVDGNWYHIKLASFGSRGVCLFGIIKEGPPDEVKGPTAFFPGGFFPLTFPDAAGLGSITGLSGGTNKFGAFRFMATDADGNLFLMRQRGYEPADTPYKPPIYAQFTASGEPRTSWSASPQPLPTSTSPISNLQLLQAWVDATAPGLNYVYNFLADAALAFGTDDSSASQAVWLGSTYQAAYALNRFSLDSEHVAVQRAQGSDNTFAAYAVFQEPVTRAWRQRLIATQIDPQGPGLQETGDHYQATVTPANAYGKSVSLLAAGNENLLIEVQADSPTTVVDDTNNFYYNVDRYTSFMAAPDPGSGHLNLLVKADVFSQVLYVRLVDKSALQPSGSDAAMLSSTAETEFAWQSVNLALQAQQRMGNGAPASSLLGDNIPLADTTVYVSGGADGTLAQSNADDPWQTKGGYLPSTANLSSVADYMNSSGQNLISATGQLSLGAANANGAIDPLYAVTAVPSDSERDTVTTAFGYSAGSVTTMRSAPAPQLAEQLGSLWGSLSHALHDALHWLQNVEGNVYNELGSGAVTIVSAVDGITVTVDREIMKQVNGVEDDLKQVVTTVEEYASVVVNVLVTIVEMSFIFRFIEILIALISLFLHFGDILSLYRSMRDFFKELFDGGGSISLPSIPDTFSSASIGGQYLGANNAVNEAFGAVDSSNVAQEIVGTIVDGVLSNPLTKKILNKVMSLISKILKEIDPPLPFSFGLDESAAQDAITDIDNLASSLVQAGEQLGVDVAEQLVQDIAADLANPQTAYKDIGEQLGRLVEGIATELLDDMFSLVDQIARDGPTLAHELISSDAYLTIDTAALADLLKLFGIGTAADSKLSLSSEEAVFFPIAVIAWVAVYLKEGKSISKVDDLQGSLSLADGELGSGVDTTLWNYARIAVDTAMQELLGAVWVVKSTEKLDEETTLTTIQQAFVALGRWWGVMRWANDLSYGVYSFAQISSPTATNYFDISFTSARTFFAAADWVLTLPGKSLNPGTGWKNRNPRRTDITQLINCILQITAMGVDTAHVVEAKPDTEAIFNITGQDIFRSQLIFVTVYNVFTLDSLFDAFVLAVLATPEVGAGLQIAALTGLTSPAPDEGPAAPGGAPHHSCAGGRGTHYGKAWLKQRQMHQKIRERSRARKRKHSVWK